MKIKHKKIVITGGTGFIAQELVRFFGRENKVVLFTRGSTGAHNNNFSNDLSISPSDYNVSYCKWDAISIENHWSKELEGADLLINLAGQTVNCRYTEKNKQALLDSRIIPTRILARAITQCQSPPKVWINASSATIYRNEYERANDEDNGIICLERNQNMPFSVLDRIRYSLKRAFISLTLSNRSEKLASLEEDISVKVCTAWEKVFFDSTTPQTRKVALRTAITLGTNGVLVPYKRLAKLGLGGKQGTGRQMFSWIHIEDLARIIDWVYENQETGNVVNCSSPNPVTNREFMSTMRRVLKVKWGIPSPKWILEIGAKLIGTETELLIKSRWVVPKKLIQSGFQFKYPQLNEALESLLSKDEKTISKIETLQTT